MKRFLILIAAGILPFVGTTIEISNNRMRKNDCESGDNLKCEFPDDCQIGEIVTVTCTSIKDSCKSEVSMKREAQCRFCWQTADTDHQCEPVANCSTSSTKLHQTICHVDPSVICIGQRKFFKKVRCNWSSGISWTKTMLLSIVLGGFGADRFYLGLWKSAIGKLFSFGGLGIWTIVDVVLIAVGYIKPADGSLYI